VPPAPLSPPVPPLPPGPPAEPAAPEPPEPAMEGGGLGADAEEQAATRSAATRTTVLALIAPF
jgi:hypothetical protein